MIKIDWFDFLKSRKWFGLYYYGQRHDGNVFARENSIYWCKMSGPPVPGKWYMWR